MTELCGRLVLLRPLAPDDAERLRQIHAAPGVSRWWGLPEDSFPFADDPPATRLTVVVDGQIAGLIQFSEETEPSYRHARIDLFLDPALHNRGLGTDALTTLIGYLLDERGHHRITIDPARANLAAIRCYEKAGFRAVGVLELAERGPDGSWHDIVLMELVRSPAPQRGSG